MRKDSSNVFWLILAAVVVVVALRSSFRREEPVRPMPLPPLMAEGWINTVSAPTPEALGGKLVVLDAWATWCGPCVEELPKLIEFHRQMGDQVALIGLTGEGGREAETVHEFVTNRQGMDWPIGYGARPTLEALGTTAFPTYYLFGRDGTLLWQGRPIRALEKQVAKALTP